MRGRTYGPTGDYNEEGPAKYLYRNDRPIDNVKRSQDTIKMKAFLAGGEAKREEVEAYITETKHLIETNDSREQKLGEIALHHMQLMINRLDAKINPEKYNKPLTNSATA